MTIVAGESNEVPFRARGVRVIDPGWTVLYPRRADKDKGNDEDEQELPEFRPGESGPHEPFLKAGETTPPKHFTESTLLGAMETAGKLVTDEQLKEALKERGLGTPATRAAIIETLLQRGYIARTQKTLTATDLGRYLVALIQDRALKSAELTGEWEAKLREIESGRLDPRQFMDEIARYTADLIRSSDAVTVDEGRLGECPRCGRPVIEGRRGFGCSGWREGCPFVLWRQYKDSELSLEQVRELLQRRVLLQPVSIAGSGPSVLQLTDSGAIVEIPVPVGRERRATVAAGRRRTPARHANRGTPAATGRRRRIPGARPVPPVRVRGRRTGAVFPMQRWGAGVRLRDLEDDCRQENRCAHSAGAGARGQECGAQGVQVQVRQVVRRAVKGSGRGRAVRVRVSIARVGRIGDIDGEA